MRRRWRRRPTKRSAPTATRRAATSTSSSKLRVSNAPKRSARASVDAEWFQIGEHSFNHFRLKPNLQFFSRVVAERRPYGQQVLQSGAGFFRVSELSVDQREDQVDRPNPRRIHVKRELERAFVIALPVRVQRDRRPIPSRMIRI